MPWRVRGLRIEKGHAPRSNCNKYEKRAVEKYEADRLRRKVDRAVCDAGLEDYLLGEEPDPDPTASPSSAS